jgi:hypothetical protein
MDELAELVLTNLAYYEYPAFRIQVGQNGNQLNFGGGLHGHFVPADVRTDRELDAYHCNLLRHESGHENLAGLASVVYWGFANFGGNDNFAQNRVGWLMEGFGNRPAVTPDAAAQCLGAARNAVMQGNWGGALAHLRPLCQLGRTPFASKVIAFLDSDHAGVYDTTIRRGLIHHRTLANHAVPGGLFANCTNGIGTVDRRQIQERYQAWCNALGRLAAHINGHLQMLPLRALDIERAIFTAIRRA